ncbi:MAG: hypothetical protein R3F34_07850 [Planctomycetota bacterium]
MQITRTLAAAAAAATLFTTPAHAAGSGGGWFGGFWNSFWNHWGDGNQGQQQGDDCDDGWHNDDCDDWGSWGGDCGPTPTGVPEIDANLLGAGALLLIGGGLVLASRSRLG